MSWKFTVTGQDAALLEEMARQNCFDSGGDCYQPKCKSRKQCQMHGWSKYVEEAASALRVIREKHRIVAKTRSRK